MQISKICIALVLLSSLSYPAVAQKSTAISIQLEWEPTPFCPFNKVRPPGVDICLDSVKVYGVDSTPIHFAPKGECPDFFKRVENTGFCVPQHWVDQLLITDGIPIYYSVKNTDREEQGGWKTRCEAPAGVKWVVLDIINPKNSEESIPAPVAMCSLQPLSPLPY